MSRRSWQCIKIELKYKSTQGVYFKSQQLVDSNQEEFLELATKRIVELRQIRWKKNCLKAVN